MKVWVKSSECGKYTYSEKYLWSSAQHMLPMFLDHPYLTQSLNVEAAHRSISFAKLFGFGGVEIVYIRPLVTDSLTNFLEIQDYLGPLWGQDFIRVCADVENFPRPIICSWGDRVGIDHEEAVIDIFKGVSVLHYCWEFDIFRRQFNQYLVK